MATVLLAAASGCPSSAAPGGFEDDLGSSDAAPPDLLETECDPRREDDCEAGFKCIYTADPEWGETNRCVEITGDGIAGDACERIGDGDSCANHFLCWAHDSDGQGGVCVPYCSVNLDCDDPLDTCSVSNGGLLPLCLPVCYPLGASLEDACPEGWGCYPDNSDRWVCDRDQSGATGVHGDPCTCLNCCDPGFVCRSGALVDVDGCGAGGAAGCCAQLCSVEEAMGGGTEGADGVCPGELESCEAYYPSDAVLMGYDDVGVCSL